MTQSQGVSTGEVVQTFLQAIGAGGGATMAHLMADAIV